jgi:hypothetical protein
MNFSRYFLQLVNVLFLGLALSFASGFTLFAQPNKPNKFMGFRSVSDSSTYIDSFYQGNLPDWRREEQGVNLNIQYALHDASKDLVLFVDFEKKLSRKEFKQLEFIKVNQRDTLFLVFQRVDSNTVKLRVRELNIGFSQVLVNNKKQHLGSLELDIVLERKERIYLVPLFEVELDEIQIQGQINKIFKPFHLRFELTLLPSFYTEELEQSKLLNNPSVEFDHYTRQMRHIRDAYFKSFPKSDRKAYYVFLHKGFVNESLEGFAAKGKAIVFVKNQPINKLSYDIAVQLARGIGGLTQPSSANEQTQDVENLMNALGGLELNPEQWRNLHLDSRRYPYYDEDEEISIFNGFVAYYFWQEKDDGSIIFDPGAFRLAIQRPYKKNYFSYHLNIEKWLFKPLFVWSSFPFSPLHMLLFGSYIFAALWLRRRWHRRLTVLAERTFRVKRVVVRIFLTSGIIVLTSITFLTINSVLSRYEIFEGVIPDFYKMSMRDVRKQILYNTEIRRSEVPEMASEVLIKRGNHWIVKRRKRVLYFDLYKDSMGVYSKARFNRESDSIIVESERIAMLAPSHYFVINRIDQNLNYESQMVFNHQGSNVTQLLQQSKEPAKRILLFVNGYRPTSLGNSLEENFRDIRERGVEFPDSKNMIHDFDRFDYWRPWRAIDSRFEKRINPSEIYYADGHFSVNTSNYRSLIHFTQVSSIYPARCYDPNNHICQNKGRTSWFRSSDDATYLLLPNRPNYTGFEKRRQNGRIAGLNLLQQLNEIPNSSDNDTLYIVAHSMGFAYGLGIIDELRGRVNFGGFYILAPENAAAGYVNPNEWKEIWQYGANHQLLKKNAPCMLDGVAPQTMVTGLNAAHQVYIPQDLYERFGFFDAHFVGFYDWIFDLQRGAKGSISQR